MSDTDVLRGTPHASTVDMFFPHVEAIRSMLATVEELWSAEGINPSEAAVLERLFIYHDGEARSGELLGHPVRSTPALGKVLASLEAKELITRSRGADDRRVVIVAGTDQAADLFQTLIGTIVEEVVWPSTAAFDEQDFARLQDLTAKMTPPGM